MGVKLGCSRRLRVFGNRVQRTLFGPKRDEVTWEWRKLNNEEIDDLYTSPNTILVIKSRRAGHEEYIGERDRCIQRFGEET